MVDTVGIPIEIRSLYKIFGSQQCASEAVELVKNGMTKAELNAQKGLVLGLKDINIDVPAGSIQVIMGLSGSGKSTLVRHINRLIDPTDGEVMVGGSNVVAMSDQKLRAFRRNNTAMVFQNFALFPHRTVLDNAVYGLEIRGLPRVRQVEQGMRWIERVGLKGYESRYPDELSGGMQQRVGLARALASDVPILLMDEAFSALDPLIRVDMQTVLLDLQKEVRKTIVFISHDLDEALRLGDQITILRDGEIIQQGSSQDIVLRPANDYIASFVKGVDRSRVVQIEAIIDPTRHGSPVPSCVVSPDVTLHAAATFLTRNGGAELGVVDAAGNYLGSVRIDQLMAAVVGLPGCEVGIDRPVPNPAVNRAG